VDVRGRSRTLRVNYHTSHQICAEADRLLGPEVTDVDGGQYQNRERIGEQRLEPGLLGGVVCGVSRKLDSEEARAQVDTVGQHQQQGYQQASATKQSYLFEIIELVRGGEKYTRKRLSKSSHLRFPKARPQDEAGFGVVS
jgi:hypothetical protein